MYINDFAITIRHERVSFLIMNINKIKIFIILLFVFIIGLCLCQRWYAYMLRLLLCRVNDNNFPK